MTTLIVLFNLREGQDAAEYERWAREIDVPTVSGLKSIDSFTVYRASGLLGSDSTSPYQYIEVVQVIHMGQFGDEIGTEEMRRVAAAFQGMADKPAFIVCEQFA